jgi:hypothetical protein
MGWRVLLSVHVEGRRVQYGDCWHEHFYTSSGFEVDTVQTCMAGRPKRVVEYFLSSVHLVMSTHLSGFVLCPPNALTHRLVFTPPNLVLLAKRPSCSTINLQQCPSFPEKYLQTSPNLIERYNTATSKPTPISTPAPTTRPMRQKTPRHHRKLNSISATVMSHVVRASR